MFVIQFYGQVAINTDGNNPDTSAGLDVKFDNKGLLVPRMTRIQRTAIASPAEGLMVYCTNCGTNGSLSIFYKRIMADFCAMHRFFACFRHTRYVTRTDYMELGGCARRFRV